MRHSRRILTIVLLAGACAIGASYGQAPAKPDPFSDAAIRVRGFGKIAPGQEGTPAGKLGAERAAKIDALRNVQALFGKMEIQGDERVKKIVVQGMVTGAKEVGDPEVKDGWVVVTMEIPLSAIAGNMVELQEKMAVAQQRNEELQEALGRADTSLQRMREALDKLNKSITDMEAKLKGGPQ